MHWYYEMRSYIFFKRFNSLSLHDKVHQCIHHITWYFIILHGIRWWICRKLEYMQVHRCRIFFSYNSEIIVFLKCTRGEVLCFVSQYISYIIFYNFVTVLVAGNNICRRTQNITSYTIFHKQYVHVQSEFIFIYVICITAFKELFLEMISVLFQCHYS